MACNCGFNSNPSFVRHICRFIGETVTVFTESGGASGCGFTGILISVNSNFIRLVNRQGSAPASPLIGPDCKDDEYGSKGCGGGGVGNLGFHHDHRGVGSVCDIPIRQIVAFCHNAV